MPTVRENLIAAKALIDTPEKWIKGVLERDGCYCVIGAVAQITPVGWALCANLLVGYLPPRFKRVPEYNDHPDTTHADIMALFDRAIDAS